jgi:hypothetical protein
MENDIFLRYYYKVNEWDKKEFGKNQEDLGRHGQLK